MAIPSLELTVGAICTIAIWSYIFYKENSVYRFAMVTMIGISLGNGALMALHSLYTNGVRGITGGNYVLIIPLVIGPFLFLIHAGGRYVRLAQWPISMLSGIGLAIAIRGSGHTYIYNQVKASFVPLTFNNAIILICLLSSLFYFLYTFDITGKPILGKFHLLGRYAIMIFLGAMFGSVTMTRLTYITGALEPVVHFFKILFSG